MAHAEKILAAPAKGHGEKAPAASATPAAAPAKKKKGKKSAGPSLGQRIQGGVKSAQGQFVDVFKSLRSPDGPTRRMAVLFFASLAGVVAIGGLAIEHHARVKREQAEREKALAEARAERDAEAELYGKTESREGEHGTGAQGGKHAATMLSLGQFTIALKPVPGRPTGGSFVNMAEVELYAECDTGATHDFLEENLAQARSQLSGVFLSVDREELLSRDGKRKLKRRILELLNGWLPRGKIKEIYFSKLVVA
jgi:flagellar basal body-associated protein FliL